MSSYSKLEDFGGLGRKRTQTNEIQSELHEKGKLTTFTNYLFERNMNMKTLLFLKGKIPGAYFYGLIVNKTRGY